MRYLRNSAEAGDVTSQLHLGFLYASGQVVLRDAGKAFHYFLLAAAQGDASAYQGLQGLLLMRQDIAPEDASKAAGLFQDQAARGNKNARPCLALVLLYGLGTETKVDAAKQLLLEEARSESPSPILLLLIKHLQWGLGSTKDPAFAKSLLQTLADHGSPDLKVELAKSLLNDPGDGPAKGLGLLRKLHEEKNAKATFELGLLYQNGRGVPLAPTKALELFRQAAERGSGEAMFHLGVLYQSGIGVKKQAAEARQWYLKAEAAGWLPAKGHVLPDGKLAPLN